jgi:hypothetical protein
MRNSYSSTGPAKPINTMLINMPGKAIRSEERGIAFRAKGAWRSKRFFPELHPGIIVL